MGIETERKFLIELPDLGFVSSMEGCRVREIVQTYLKDERGTGAERRVRKITEGENITYVFTRKEHVTKMSRIEDEREISPDEYTRLYTEAKSELKKTRYAFPFGERIVEIDVYPYEIGGDAMNGKAVLEVELESEDEAIDLPEFVKVIRELTGTGEFSNKKLAKKIK
ncbi:MAG: hypothetical protein E7587_10555 [Ruminococcaceae bacterium]|nr:hypothetical protein [Oscillospiraceae bacterium]MBE6696874.1 hypothetical protein [Oscillospiraceae bacterium]